MPENKARKGRPDWFRHLPQLTVLAVIALTINFISPGFFHVSIQNGRLFGSLIDVLYRGAPIILLALGMTMVIATGGIDLSVGAVIAIAGAAAAKLVELGFPAWQVIFLALVSGAACGLWNGFLVAGLRIQPFVATLILMVSGRGIAQMITEGRILTFTDPGMDMISKSSLMYVPMPIIIALGFLLLGLLIWKGTALGLMIAATGLNRVSAASSGVKTRLVTTLAYVWCGFCASAAGLIIVSDIRGADANNAGLWLEMDAILATVIGGTSLLGGRFWLPMSMVGALIIQAMNTGVLLSGLKPEFNYIVKALLVLIVLCAQSPALKQRLGKPAGGAA